MAGKGGRGQARCCPTFTRRTVPVGEGEAREGRKMVALATKGTDGVTEWEGDGGIEGVTC